MRKELLFFLVLIAISLLVLVHGTFALKQVAGNVIIPVEVESSNSTKFGIGASGNESSIVSLRAEGNAKEFLTFPEIVELPAGEIVYVEVTADIPKDYDGRYGNNITGYIYALEEGQSGNQVKINFQIRKDVNILVSGAPEYSSTTPVSAPEETSTGTSESASNISGRIAIPSYFLPVSFIMFVLVLGLLVYLLKNKGGEKVEWQNYRGR